MSEITCFATQRHPAIILLDTCCRQVHNGIHAGVVTNVAVTAGHGGALISRRGMLHDVHGQGLCALPLHGDATGMEHSNETT